jgi:hypothetical protein
MTIFKIPIPAASIQTALFYGTSNVSIISTGVSFISDGSTVVSDYSTTFPTGSYSSGGGGGGGGTGANGATGATGPAGTTTSIVFDGGWPDQSYLTGPVFDCGGIF